MRTSKNITVLASAPDDKATFIGSVIWKSGLSMKLVEELEKNGRSRYSQIPEFFQAKHQQLAFETRTSDCVFIDNMEGADTAMILLDANASAEQSVRFLESISNAASGTPTVIVLIDKMDEVDWSTRSCEAYTLAIAEYLRSPQWPIHLSKMIPISATRGDNILEPTRITQWYSKEDGDVAEVLSRETVFEAIDA